MRLLPALAILGLFAPASAQIGPQSIAQPASLTQGTTTNFPAPMSSTGPADTLAQNSKRLLDAQDRKTALAQAEAAVEAGGGAEAYAARGDAEYALGETDSALLDYAEAARRDPARYGAKYKALQARLETQLQSKTDKKARKAALGGVGGVSIFIILGLAGSGTALLVFGLIFLRRKKTAGKFASEL